MFQTHTYSNITGLKHVEANSFNFLTHLRILACIVKKKENNSAFEFRTEDFPRCNFISSTYP